MVLILVALAFLHQAHTDYSRAFVETFTQAESVLDKAELVQNVNTLRNAVLNNKLELMSFMTDLETLLQRTVVLESADFMVPETSVSQNSAQQDEHAIDCNDVRKLDVPMSNEQMADLYGEYVMHMTNIKTFKSNIFLLIAQIRAKVNMLEPDLSSGQAEQEEGGEKATPSDASLERKENSLKEIEGVDEKLRELRKSLDEFYDDYRQMVRVSRQMRCVNNRILDLIHGDAKKENLVLYKIATSIPTV